VALLAAGLQLSQRVRVAARLRVDEALQVEGIAGQLDD
jgi:hypothetical protein